jgi:hypothetical protein
MLEALSIVTYVSRFRSKDRVKDVHFDAARCCQGEPLFLRARGADPAGAC